MVKTELKHLRNISDELDVYFRMVANTGDWKAPINTTIRITDQKLVARAIEFYTASKAQFYPIDKIHCKVWAPGYRLGPAGDH